MARYTKDVQHPMNQAVAAELRAELARYREPARQRGLTQQEIAERSGVPETTIGKILRGDAMIDVKQLDVISLALHIQPNVIIARAEQAVLARGGDIEGWAGRPESETGS